MSVENFADVLTANIRTIGGDMLHHTAVVVGSAAIYMAFPDSARRPHDIDLSVPHDIYEQLRTLPDWRISETTYRSKNILRTQQFDIGVGWGGMDHAALFKRSWQSPDGLHITNLSTIYSWKRARRATKDKKDASIIHENLHASSPLSFDLMRYEIASIASCLPAHLRNHSHRNKAVHLAAHGLLAAFSRNYQPRHFYSQNSIETLAMFRHTEDSVAFLIRQLRHVITHATIATLSIDEQFLAIISLLYSDLLYHLEKPSNYPVAPLALQHALFHGYETHQAQRIGHVASEISSQKPLTDPIAKILLTASQACC